jgi:hypothetical protein
MTARSRTAFLALALAIFACRPGVRAAEPALVLEQTIELKDVSGRIDHMAVNLPRKQLYVAELGNNTVDVVDIAGGQVEPQGIGYSPQADVIAIASAGDGTVRLFRGKDFYIATTVNLGDDADNVRVDPTSGRFIVGYGSGGLAVIDPADGRVISRTKLPAHPEGFQIDAGSGRAFVNLPDDHQIAVVDIGSGKQISGWRLPGRRANFPMGFDAPRKIVASVFRSPPRLVLLDANSGTVKESLTACSDADDVFFDGNRRRIYVSCGSGSVDVFEADGDGYRKPTSTKTNSGARTSLFVPELDRLFVARRAGMLGSTAAILVFRPTPQLLLGHWPSSRR